MCKISFIRLLQLLPPSAPYMERLTSGEQFPAGSLLLHSLVWGPRCGHKNFTRWLKDCFVKQGLNSNNLEKMIKAASDSVNNLKHDVTNAKNCIIALTPDVKKGMKMTYIFVETRYTSISLYFRVVDKTEFATALALIFIRLCTGKGTIIVN